MNDNQVCLLVSQQFNKVVIAKRFNSKLSMVTIKNVNQTKSSKWTAGKRCEQKKNSSLSAKQINCKIDKNA